MTEWGPDDWKPSHRAAEFPGCFKCRHLDRKRMLCAAFGGPVPLPIASGQVDHMIPRPGDHGITFEPIEAEVKVGT